jgi:flagellin-like protein
MRRIAKDKSNIYTKLLKDKKGISPVITTVILVAVGIALAVAIGLWMSGLVATFTRFEKLEVTSAYAIASSDSTKPGWNVTVVAKNTGSADATITTIMINGIPTTDSSVKGVSVYYLSDTTQNSFDPSKGVTVPVGTTVTFKININGPSASTPGQIGSTKANSGITLNIVLHSAAGKDYPASVTLP